MAWYDTGTVNVTNGSTAVVGVGTNFISGAQVGEGFYGPDNRLYEIQAIVSATSLTLADVYLGTTQTGQGYKIVPTQSLVAALATQVSTLISDFQGVVDEAGSGKFDDGTATSAGITFTLDQDTGIFRPAANQIGFTTAGVERVKITNAGIDVTGTVTADGLTVDGDAEINGDILIDSGSATPLHVDRSSSTGAATVQVSNSTHTTYFGTRIGGGFAIDDDADLSLGPWLVIDTAGQVGIGATSPSAALDVVGDTEINGNLEVIGTTPRFDLIESDAASADTTRLVQQLDAFRIQTTNNGAYISEDYAIEKNATGATVHRWRVQNSEKMRINSSGVGIGTTNPTETLVLEGDAPNILISNTSETAAGVMFGDAQALATQNASIKFDSGTERLGLSVNNVERMNIDGNGNTSFNATKTIYNDNTDEEGFIIGNTGTLQVSRVSVTPILINRQNTLGGMISFYADGVYKGGISVSTSDVAYNTTSDYRLKENITPVQGAADIVKAMQPVTYTFKSDGSWHDGFLAHELQELHPRAVIGEKDAMVDEEYEVTPAVYEDVTIPAVEAVAEVPAVYDDEGVLVSEMVPAVEAQPERTEQQLVSEAVMGTRSVPDYQGVDYSKLTPILTAALQEALNKIDALEARLAAANI